MTAFSVPTRSYEDPSGLTNLSDAAGNDNLLLTVFSQRARCRGVVPAARCAFSANPANLDTITLGGHEFRYVTTLGAATTHTQIMVLGSAALALAATLDAINGVTNASVVQATTPFAGLVVADAATATVLRLRKALTRGGLPDTGTASLTLAASITGGASAWSITNLSAAGGKDVTDQDVSVFSLTVTAAMVTATGFNIELPFTPTVVHWTAYTSAGVPRATTDNVTISGNSLLVAMAGGAAPALQATDTVRGIVIA